MNERNQKHLDAIITLYEKQLKDLLKQKQFHKNNARHWKHKAKDLAKGIRLRHKLGTKAHAVSFGHNQFVSLKWLEKNPAYTETLYEITRSECGTGEWANHSREFQRGFEVGVMELQRCLLFAAKKEAKE